MANKLLVVTVRGSRFKWSFQFYGDPRNIPEWDADGLEVYEVVNIIPAWVVNLGLIKPWWFFQNVFNFRWPWR